MIVLQQVQVVSDRQHGGEKWDCLCATVRFKTEVLFPRTELLHEVLDVLEQPFVVHGLALPVTEGMD